MDLSSLQTTALRLSARLSENLSETARDLGLQGLDAASIAGIGVSGASGAFSGGAGKYLEDGAVVTQDGVREIKKLLETRREASMAEGLRRVLAMMQKGKPVLTFFPQVVQCLSSSSSSSAGQGGSASANLQIRSLVSLYLLRQANLEPDLALLPVNMYQRDLRDPNPVVRTLALRTLAGMGLDSIAALVLTSIRTASRDTNWLVRRTAAESLEKVYSLDPAHMTSLHPVLETLLADRHALVLGSALAAFELLRPDQWDMLHPQYRHICRCLVDIDEWGQITALRILERYARLQFRNPELHKMDPDLELLLKSVETLFFNANAAVVLAACRLYYRLAPSSHVSRTVTPLLRLLSSPPALQSVALAYMVKITADKPQLFAGRLNRFCVVQTEDSAAVQAAKLQILINLVNTQNIQAILRELMIYVQSSDPQFIIRVVNSIGECALRMPRVRERCLRALTKLVVRDTSQHVSTQALLQIRHILGLSFDYTASDSSATTECLAKLVIAYLNRRIKSSNAQQQLFLLIGHFLHVFGANLAGIVDVVRVGTKAFAIQSEATKLALLILSTKLVIALSRTHSDADTVNALHLLHSYAMTLAKFDKAWSVRDSARFLSAYLETSGVKLHIDAANDSFTQDAFAKGEIVDTPAVANNELPADKLRDTLLAVFDARDAATIAENTRPKAVLNTGDLGTFGMLSSGFAKFPSTTHSSLPSWRTEPSESALRNPPPDDGAASSKSAYGGGGFSARQGSLKQTSRVTKTSTRAPMEKVVLIPVERDDQDQAQQPRDLNTFLADSDEEDRYPARAADQTHMSSEEDSSESEESESDDEEEDESSAEDDGNYMNSSTALLARPSPITRSAVLRPG